MSPDDPRHGKRSGGRIHRADGEPVCAPCLRAESRYQNVRVLEKMEGKVREVPALGTQRRIQALVALGHSMTHIGAELGVTGQSVWNLANRDLAYTRTSTALKIAQLYESMSMRLPDESTSKGAKAAKYARTVAKKRGWVVPLAWDDGTIDDPKSRPQGTNITKHHKKSRTSVDEALVALVLAGEWGRAHNATVAERVEICRRWVSTGASLNDLEQLTGWKSDRYWTISEGAA